MNKTSYLPNRSTGFSNHMRRKSLDTLQRVKNSPIQEQQASFRKSCSSFDKISKKSRQELPQIKYEKQMDSNIYFNTKSRANYFKNLIDSYFQKNQNQPNHNKSTQNSSKKSFLLRKSIVGNKNKQVQDIFVIKDSQFKNQDLKQPKYGKQTQQSKRRNQLKKTSISIRYQQHQGQISGQDFPQNQTYAQDIKKFTDQSLSSKEINPKKRQSSPSNLALPESSFLPKITEAGDDGEDDFIVSSSQSITFDDTNYILKSQNSFKRLDDQKVLVYENGVIRLYIMRQNDKKYRIKQFKSYIFLNRHKRAIQFDGITNFWKPYRFNELSLMIPYIFPLKDLLYQLIPHPTSPQFFYINPKPLYHRLLSKNCQDLIILFRELMKDVKKISQKVINNKINLSNIFYLNGKFTIGDWEYSAFKEENKIQGNHFESRVQPILKCQNQWLVSPQYLAPEILQSVQNTKNHFDLWQHQNTSDIYSLGISFLEIITLVPMWMQHKSTVNGRMMKPRQGCLATSNRSVSRILQKQELLVPKVSTILERQIPEDQKNWKFFNILLKMVEPNRQKRIKIEQIISQTL